MMAGGPLPMLQAATASATPAAAGDGAGATEAASPFAFLLPATTTATAPGTIDAGALAVALFGGDEIDSGETVETPTESPLLLWLPWMTPPADAAPPTTGGNGGTPAGAGALPGLAATTAGDGSSASLLAGAATAAAGTAGALADAAASTAELTPSLAAAELLNNATDAAAEAGDARPIDSAGTHRHGPPRASFELAVPTSPAARFGDALADGVEGRLQWMAEQRIGRAQIRLSPAELGTIDIQLQLDGKQVRAEFSSANADVRQVLESQLPRLRDMFQAQGMTLTHADVGHRHDPQDGQPGARSDGFGVDGEAAASETEAPVLTMAALRQRIGLLDEYA